MQLVTLVSFLCPSLLISRLIPQVTVTTWPTPLRMFVNVTATSGVAAAWGIHHYLKYSPIGAHFSWMANNLSECAYQKTHCV